MTGALASANTSEPPRKRRASVSARQNLGADGLCPAAQGKMGTRKMIFCGRARAALYREQVRKLRIENDVAEEHG